MKEGWELMRLKGIPLRVHPSWFVILFLFTWTSQGQVVRVSQTQLAPWTSWGLGLITALLLFLSVLLHELGHSFVAINEGIKVKSITLFLLGGVARVEKECATPMAALRVAAAGPIVSFLLAIALLTPVSSVSNWSPLFGNLLGQIGSLNLVLGLFNLLPGLPLDGGLILKALVWKWTGSQRKGIQVATNTGRFLAIFAIVLGLWVSLQGRGIGGLWLIMLGWFGLSASRSQSQMLVLQEILCELTVSDARSRRFRVLEEDQPLRRLSELRLSKNSEDSSPEWILLCRSGRWVGYLTDNVLKDIPVQNWDKYTLGDHQSPLTDLPSVGEKIPLWQAVNYLEKSDEGRLLVFSSAGLPCGTLDRVDLGQAVLKKLGIDLPGKLLSAARAHNTYPLGMSLNKIVEAMFSSGSIEKPD
ncbi:site-2 protease family protein [Prochlorococcus sp. MIT 1341]|uniref:site-2 protease family protein n=1 Tax=Prochlorococcus sp. MIT 1341 TaxID=3096221 RepID=UPI002A750DEA|nr:site-2 protease family protein [Prochlorococcus sp. MIT 1341]